MPYDNRPPQQRHDMHNEHHEESGKSFEQLLDCIASELCRGAMWHGAAAPQMDKIGLRGFGRMHAYQSHHDFCKLYGDKTGTGGLLKILCDRLEYCPNIDTEDFAAAVRVAINSPADVKQHLHAWKESEKEFAHYLTEAVRMAASIDMCLYNELACILSAVEEEIMRIKILRKRLDLGGWDGHDLARISKDLHNHYEHHADLGMDVNLG